jgi:DnaK suppressor protein
MSKRNAKKTASAKTLSAGSKPAARPVKEKGATTAKGKAAAAKSRTAGKKMASRAKASSIVLPPDYRPSEDEPFMNERQRLYFRQKLVAWKEEIIRQTRETLAGLHEESTQHADLADRATSETDRALELRARDRQRKLVAKIDAALARIEDGSYGYCEETGEPIGLKRLDARPIATLSVEAQERHERRERVYRED